MIRSTSFGTRASDIVPPDVLDFSGFPYSAGEGNLDATLDACSKKFSGFDLVKRPMCCCLESCCENSNRLSCLLLSLVFVVDVAVLFDFDLCVLESDGVDLYRFFLLPCGGRC